MLTMGTPTSKLVAEICLLHFEYLFIKHNIDKNSIVFHTTHVDDIRFIYDHTKVPPTQTLNLAN